LEKRATPVTAGLEVCSIKPLTFLFLNPARENVRTRAAFCSNFSRDFSFEIGGRAECKHGGILLWSQRITTEP
jgi:hypothetical protein